MYMKDMSFVLYNHFHQWCVNKVTHGQIYDMIFMILKKMKIPTNYPTLVKWVNKYFTCTFLDILQLSMSNVGSFFIAAKASWINFEWIFLQLILGVGGCLGMQLTILYSLSGKCIQPYKSIHSPNKYIAYEWCRGVVKVKDLATITVRSWFHEWCQLLSVRWTLTSASLMRQTSMLHVHVHQLIIHLDYILYLFVLFYIEYTDLVA